MKACRKRSVPFELISPLKSLQCTTGAAAIDLSKKRRVNDSMDFLLAEDLLERDEYGVDNECHEKKFATWARKW